MTASFENDGLRFEVIDEGPRDGEAVVLLHGFPQDPTSYDKVVPHLHAAGLRTLRPELRGYGQGHPADPQRYRLRMLASDVVALLDACGIDSAHVVGHDWGGAMAWATAAWHPGRVSTLTVLATPHPAAMSWAYTRTTQGLTSWYMLAFTLPVVPEQMISRSYVPIFTGNGMQLEDAERYAERFSTPKSLTGPLAWYRAEGMGAGLVRGARAALSGQSPDPVPSVSVPTTYVYGNRDAALKRAAAERTARHVTGDYRFVELDANHWLPENAPGAVSRAIVARVIA